MREGLGYTAFFGRINPDAPVGIVLVHQYVPVRNRRYGAAGQHPGGNATGNDPALPFRAPRRVCSDDNSGQVGEGRQPGPEFIGKPPFHTGLTQTGRPLSDRVECAG